MAASTCAADFKETQEDLDKTNDMLQNVVKKVCGKQGKDKCVEAIAEVQKEMSEAVLKLQDTVDDCDDVKDSCHDDLDTAYNNFIAGSIDLGHAYDACG